MTAFDYKTQTWTDGPEARQLRRSQLETEIGLLTGPRGDQYAQFMGLKKATALAAARAELGQLTAIS